MKPLYKSHKFWAAILAGVSAFCKQMGLAIPDELFAIIIAWILGQGLADLGKNKKPEE